MLRSAAVKAGLGGLLLLNARGALSRQGVDSTFHS